MICLYFWGRDGEKGDRSQVAASAKEEKNRGSWGRKEREGGMHSRLLVKEQW